MIDIEEIIKQTDEYDIVTFDVFDTLIIRDVRKPSDVFRLAYGTIGKLFRIFAEMIAGKCLRIAEVKLSDINKFFLFSTDKEVLIEKNVCRANPKIHELVEKLIDQGKKVYAISDMYLSEQVISDILNMNGYNMPVYVSSEFGCGKSDGSLFKAFLNENNFAPEQVIHIGDSEKADNKGAKAAGLASIKVDKHCNELAYMKYRLKNHEFVSFVNHGIAELNNPSEKIGYEIVGPIILGFCQWIHDLYTERNIDTLFFLARDMHFAYEIYRYLYPDDNSRYLYVSRKSLNYSRNHPEEMAEYLKNEGCYKNVYIVDTGWVGRAQVEIEKYSRMIENSSDIGGLYLGSKLAFRRIKRSDNSFVYMYRSWRDQFKCQLFPGFMETLIGSNEKQVVSYVNGQPVFDRDEDRDKTNDIKLGARRFVEEWNCIKNKKIDCLDISKKCFEKLFYSPKSEHVSLLGNLHYEDFKDTKIVTDKKALFYFLHPATFLNDLSESVWKGAFFNIFGFGGRILLFLYFVFGSIRLYFVDIRKINKDIL